MPHNPLIRANRAIEETKLLIQNGIIPSELRQWFAGFVDAEGCLGVYKNQAGSLHFSIGQRNQENLDLLRALMNTWHIALFSIKEKANICEGAYSPTTVPELRSHSVTTCSRLFTVLNGYLCHPDKLEVLKQWSEYLSCSITEGRMTDAWLAGFFEGDGCIHSDHGSCLSFSILQKNKKILELLQAYLGLGHIYEYHRESKTYFTFSLCGNNALQVVQRILPYIKFLSSKEKILKALKNKGATDIDSQTNETIGREVKLLI